MTMENFLTPLGRVFFLALGLIAIAAAEIAANLFSSSLVGFRYGAERL
jgi:hypothetical protein